MYQLRGAGFENNNWGGWQTICATATNGVGMVTNPVAYTPPGGCSSPAGSPQQHSLWTGGNDAIGGFPRVFQGGVLKSFIGVRQVDLQGI